MKHYLYLFTGIFLFLFLSAVTSAVAEQNVGYASWYGQKHHGKRTASGERFDMNSHTAAHRNLKFGTKVRVSNLENGKSTVVEINDRGPFVKKRIIDLSYAAASELEFVRDGTCRVRLEILDK